MTRTPGQSLINALAVHLSQVPWQAQSIRLTLSQHIPPALHRSLPTATRHLIACLPGPITPDPQLIARALRSATLAHRLDDHYRSFAPIIRHAAGPTPFRPAAALATLPLPRLETPQDLCDRLAITPDQLTLLADLNGLSARNPNPYAQNYLHHLIPKPNGTHRLIEEPRPLLKKVQRRILTGILSHVPPHPAAHGFVQGRSAPMAAAKHCGEQMVLTFDIQNFFPSIPFAKIYAIFRSLGFPRPTALPLTAICTAWPNSHYKTRHLPQGAPTSPALANLAALRLDARLTGLARVADATYTRYADDLTFSGDTRIKSLLHTVPHILRAEGFTPNPTKTRHQASHQNQTVTGITVNQHLNLNRPAYDLLKSQIHHLTTGRQPVTPATLAHIQGRLDWLAQLNPAKAARLRDKLASTPVAQTAPMP